MPFILKEDSSILCKLSNIILVSLLLVILVIITITMRNYYDVLDTPLRIFNYTIIQLWHQIYKIDPIPNFVLWARRVGEVKAQSWQVKAVIATWQSGSWINTFHDSIPCLKVKVSDIVPCIELLLNSSGLDLIIRIITKSLTTCSDKFWRSLYAQFWIVIYILEFGVILLTPFSLTVVNKTAIYGNIDWLLLFST